ncbi:MAG TPA: PQQ-binding-like beta-propeller repeat protein [Candidatus Dormibacteraeota bacterium]|nr:PQQ-binding-like beta-propeller repeat protein [Candidatus Dormibacteraeota bacterium]
MKAASTLALCLTACASIVPQHAWTMYQYRADNNAVFAAPAWDVAWSRRLGGRVNGALSIVGDTLYVESFDRHLYALDARTGRVRWQSMRLANIAMNAPLVSNGLVIVGTGNNRWLYDTPQGALMGVPGGDVVYAFDARSGALVWRRAVRGQAMPTGVIASVGGRPALLFAAGDGVVRALSLHDGSLLWRTAYPGFDSMSSLVATGGLVVGASAVSPQAGLRIYRKAQWNLLDEESWTWAVRATDGRIAWTSPHGWGDSSPVAADGRIFVESMFVPIRTQSQLRHGMTISDGTPLQSRVYALDAANGAKVWEYDDPAVGPYIPGGTLELAIAGTYAGGVFYDSLSFSEQLAAFDAKTGRVLWTVRTRAPVRMSPVVYDGNVYFGDVAGYFYVVRAFDGDVESRLRFPVGFSASPPVVVGRTLFVADGDTIYARRLRDLEAETAFPGASVRADGSLAGVDGASSSQEYALLPGATVTIRARIAKGAIAGSTALVFGSVYTNGYGVTYDGNGDVYLERWVGGARSVLGSIVHHRNGTGFHTFVLTLVVRGVGSNLLSAAFDGDAVDAQPLRDTSLNLVAGPFPASVFTAGQDGSMQDYSVTLVSARPSPRS